MRRLFAAAFIAAALFAACSDSSGPQLSFTNATLVAGQVNQLDHAVATPQLVSLGTLALSILNAGIGVTTMDSSKLGRTMEWQPITRILDITSRTGAPAGALRIILYQNDGSVPRYPFVEIGTADLYPYNSFTGGGPDSMSLRYVVRNLAGDTLGDFTAHSHFDANCQCATVEGWVSDGTTRLNFVVPYSIPQNGDGDFQGSFSAAGTSFHHRGTLPGPLNTTATGELSFKSGGDSIATSSLLKPSAGRLIGESTIRVNGQALATIHETADSFVVTGAGGRDLTGAEQSAVRALLRLPADIDFYIEWPTFVVFFCGC